MALSRKKDVTVNNLVVDEEKLQNILDLIREATIEANTAAERLEKAKKDLVAVRKDLDRTTSQVASARRARIVRRA
jgi:hypothetical protein